MANHAQKYSDQGKLEAFNNIPFKIFFLTFCLTCMFPEQEENETNIVYPS
jgi:hypothetical protein